MNFSKLTSVLSLALMLFASVTSYAATDVDKTTKKAREAVEAAAPDDWQTLAEAAEKCIRKGVNLKEAASWLDKSLEIKEDAYNLKVKAFYYEENNLPEKALKYYTKSYTMGKEENFYYEDEQTQRRIGELVKELQWKVKESN